MVSKLGTRVVLVSLAAVGCAAALGLFFFDPDSTGVYPVCLFHRFTGFECPGCGATRALYALLHGRWRSALHDNLMLVVSLPLLAWLGFCFLRQQARDGPPVAIRPVWLWIWLCAWIAFGVVRNLPGPASAWLRP